MINLAVKSMLDKYNCVTRQDYINALKEIIQEVALVGLWRAKFFDCAAFYGGTALRILFNLERFSEDLDFTLLTPDANFSLKPYLQAIQNELNAFGFNVEVAQKEKSRQSAIHSAFLKGLTSEHFLKIGVKSSHYYGLGTEEVIKIKLEVDTDPPPAFETTAKYLLQPIPCGIRVVAEPDLFAGKMHALLCRSWQTRVKGRDWYDFIWYVARGTPLNLKHLEARMRQSAHYEIKEPLTTAAFKQRLKEKIQAVSFLEAKKDVLPFIKDIEQLHVWSPEFFESLIDRIDVLN